MPSAQEIVQSFEELRTIPHIALRVCQLISHEETTIRQIEETIQLDPVLVSRILRMVNSAYYGLRKPIASLPKAIIFLGLKNLRNLVVIDALRGVFLREQSNGTFSRKQLWIHCTAVGVCARMIARRLLGRTGEDTFLAGILHDIGLIVEDQTHEALFREVIERYRAGTGLLIEYEQELLGTDHCAVGEALAARWGFPEAVQQAILHHHTAIEHEAELQQMPAVLQIAHHIANTAGYQAFSEKTDPPLGIIVDHIQQQAVEYQALTEAFCKEMEKAARLYEDEGI
ncbi:MAG: HDOD domain-containing protein [Nitrospinota bacterium]|nr:MAG: HDOD domain-containing protein [Nitrospinota bacterium]